MYMLDWHGSWLLARWVAAKHGFTIDASAITFRLRPDYIPKRNLDYGSLRSLVDGKCIGDGWRWNLGWGPIGGDLFMITTFKGWEHCVAHRFELARTSFEHGNRRSYETNVTLGILNAWSYSSVALDAEDNVFDMGCINHGVVENCENRSFFPRTQDLLEMYETPAARGVVFNGYWQSAMGIMLRMRDLRSNNGSAVGAKVMAARAVDPPLDPTVGVTKVRGDRGLWKLGAASARRYSISTPRHIARMGKLLTLHLPLQGLCADQLSLQGKTNLGAGSSKLEKWSTDSPPTRHYGKSARPGLTRGSHGRSAGYFLLISVVGGITLLIVVEAACKKNWFDVDEWAEMCFGNPVKPSSDQSFWQREFLIIQHKIHGSNSVQRLRCLLRANREGLQLHHKSGTKWTLKWLQIKDFSKSKKDVTFNSNTSTSCSSLTCGTTDVAQADRVMAAVIEMATKLAEERKARVKDPSNL
jgi:hypothetical protein